MHNKVFHNQALCLACFVVRLADGNFGARRCRDLRPVAGIVRALPPPLQGEVSPAAFEEGTHTAHRRTLVSVWFLGPEPAQGA